jgi:hypothetical protein
MTAWSEHIQRLSVSEEDSGLSVPHNYVGSNAIIAYGCVIREAMDDFFRHFVRIFNNIENARHFVSPLN